MKVLIIPEDPTHDPHIIKPIIEAILSDLGRRAWVDVLRDPHLRGTSDALDADTIAGVIADNPMIDLFILVVDRDCDRDHNEAKAAARTIEHAGRLVACLARQEVEVWMLALHLPRVEASWTTIREECDPKERFGAPLLHVLGSTGPGAGRKAAMRALPGNLRSLLSRCDELARLRADLDDWWRQRT